GGSLWNDCPIDRRPARSGPFFSGGKVLIFIERNLFWQSLYHHYSKRNLDRILLFLLEGFKRALLCEILRRSILSFPSVSQRPTGRSALNTPFFSHVRIFQHLYNHLSFVSLIFHKTLYNKYMYKFKLKIRSIY